MNYYNEYDPNKIAWLRALIQAGLIPHGEVDPRSIADVQPGDLRGFCQCHFFAGIGGWAYAMRLAGWPDDRPVWTFSCPCQRFSSSTRGRSVADDLWPEQRCLLAAMRPGEFFGEQVAAARDWFDGLCFDVAPLGYQVGAAVLPAVSVGHDHARPRIYFVGHTNRDGEPELSVNGEVAGVPWRARDAGGMVSEDGLSRDMVALSGFGNAIVPQVAAEFIGAYLDACG